VGGVGSDVSKKRKGRARGKALRGEFLNESEARAGVGIKQHGARRP